MIKMSQCMLCKHLNKISPWQCVAFKNIPNSILLNRIDHRQPIGNESIVFEALPGKQYPTSSEKSLIPIDKPVPRGSLPKLP